jgi:cysteinyl-tRNA synthetase
MHNNLLELDSKKMSKSEGNIIKIRDLLEVYPGDVVRFLILAGQYRQPIDWTQSGLESARQELFEWSKLVSEYFNPDESLSDYASPDAGLIEALSDDLNTSVGLAYLRETFRLAQQEKIPIERFVGNVVWLGFRHLNHPGFFDAGFNAHLYESGSQIGEDEVKSIIGFRAASANGLFQTSERLSNELEAVGFRVVLDDAGILSVGNMTSGELAERDRLSQDRYALSSEGTTTKIDRDRVDALIKARTAARQRRDFEESDRIRDILAEMNVELEDHKDGTTTWNPKRNA